ncbi:OprO/OprP family phosphate-selective porin [Bacteroides sp. OttesenSCG-928-J23]|nr:OprO/OprP family phosphate-selective porin [Bacteroides sp. OttesenSCG-928-N06]MDL2248027.1 OprO/OprP family phosphate-selective porin [Bacteroides sp. OttesenSCG-928-J23]MDL2303841.1 OprO/OprP family phosphate-selective porin [Bacteroides sp. OttesenSCG-928-D19]
MRKIICALACTIVLSIKVQAQHRESENFLEKLIWNQEMLNIMVDTRIDFQTEFGAGELDYAGFRGQTFRVWLVGEIIPGIRYRVRHRFNKPQTPFIRDNYSGATDQAWLAFDIGKKWTITAGKQSMQLGTFEYDYNGADLYQTTMVNGDIDIYKTGINVAYKFSGQTINLQVVNSDAPQFANSEYKNKAFAINTLWVGSLFDNTLRTRWGYGIFQHSKSKFYNWLTLGTQLNLGEFTTEVDYFLGSRNMDYGTIVSDTELGSRYVQDQSVALNLKYNLGRWKPFIKGTWNQRHDKVFASNAYESMGVEAALEFYPFTREVIKDLRFHVAYAYLNTDFQGEFASLKNNNIHTVLVGTRWLFKVK